MPIIRNEGGSTSITGEGISLYRLLALRACVKLEAKGIKMARRSITAQAMRELGCKRRDVLAALDKAIEAKGTEVRAENEQVQS